MKIRTLLVDDEPLARDRLRAFVSGEPAFEIIGECGSGTDAIAAIRRDAPDLVFLDMQMPGCDGLQVMAELPEDRRPAVIFATAHERFALDAFDVAAVDYLLKPFDRERCQQALRRAQEAIHARRTAVPAPAPAAAPDRITVKADGRLVFLKPEEIVRVEAADNYVMLHLASGRLMLRETMAAIEARLGTAGFARINRSAIVNLDQVREIQPAQHGDYQVVLRDGTALPLSRSLRGKLDRFVTGEA
ncbi:MAG: two-component system, LytTR family, response regulator [Verrucomicrobiota bacterium]|nr:two-component system, LytTR family, response regulator [Verrucomicrobiota bacterium]